MCLLKTAIMKKGRKSSLCDVTSGHQNLWQASVASTLGQLFLLPKHMSVALKHQFEKERKAERGANTAKTG